ncbi:group III truncated hemoglobin [Flagellimonas hymeniacidonis]|uniref:Group III truncated hemoglobin n=1 Tax=Flagellimonas hymeniacidonis TaxID=2603628 RepID=A0A5C8V723_9FLAO|nr:group III truncated hemoglobin [Flagellimonas hymeniacidonis]TXN36949.1 group III truncated hemoglobin [Flagellimonas hymeniacidonis]
MARVQIETRKEVRLLVTQFYDKVRKDAEIGHFFNETIDDWPAHMDKLVDFWETNLFFVQKYKGNPLMVHAELDEKMNHEISNYHFGIWLRHWIETIDANFVGENAEKAKQRARNISVRMFMTIFEHRKHLSSK